MNYEIKNRIEAFLSWKTTGIKPEGWDLEPRNKQEYYLAEEAKRLDRLSGDSVETGKKAASRSSNDSADYNSLNNIPILPVEGEIVNGEYYYQPAGEYLLPISSSTQIVNGTKWHFDTSLKDEFTAYLATLSYMSEPVICPLYGAENTTGGQIMLMAFSGEGHYGVFLGYGRVGVNIFDDEKGFNREYIDDNGDYTFTFEDSSEVYQTTYIIDGYWNQTVCNQREMVSNTIGKAVNGKIIPLKTDDNKRTYKYDCQIYNYGSGDGRLYFSLIGKDIIPISTVINHNYFEEVFDYLESKGFTDENHRYPAEGKVGDYSAFGLYVNVNEHYIATGYNNSGTEILHSFETANDDKVTLEDRELLF